MQMPPEHDPYQWHTYACAFAALLAAELHPESVHAWLQRWSELDKQIWEARAHLKRRKSWDAADAAAQAAFQRYTVEVMGPYQVASQQLKSKLLAHGPLIQVPEYQQMLRRLRNETALFVEQRVALENEIGRLAGEYSLATSAMPLVLHGRELDAAEIAERIRSADRDTRAETWHMLQQPWLDRHDSLAALILKQVALRRELAKQAGLADYRAYRWRELNRLDYTSAECEALHAAIESEIVPLGEQLRQRRRKQLGLPTLRPWDLEASVAPDPHRWPLASPEALEAGMAPIFTRLDPALGEVYGKMRDGFLDLGIRRGKAGGSEEWLFPATGMPYVRVATTLTADDATLLLHEMGHAFHDYLALQAQGSIWGLDYPSEVAEFAAITMSHFGLVELAGAGGLLGRAAAQAHQGFVAEVVARWLPQIALVDAFQHWLYAEAPDDLAVDDLDRKWVELYQRFMPGVDWQDLDTAWRAGWLQQGLLVSMPFYSIEYAFAHLGALQVWRRSQGDRAGAWRDYQAALALGSTRPLPELFEAAGVALPIDPMVVHEIVEWLRPRLSPR